MQHRLLLALMLVTGFFVGLTAALFVVLALSPVWPLALLMLAALPFGYWFSHRPWHGKRKPGEMKRFLRQLFGPPVAAPGIAMAIGALIGAGTGFPWFGRIVWGQ
ncbi:hypothetical protein [Aestuariicoccus sp. MJ-SS9]|uniref:hypothetical protein n=1 Tax=Aestuariicoccus sp. MJ-SS9 TaxID=3079855 RepID=UPI00290CC166|nr:hypothetical protein [Aestuariicoccus sp. MJ-SS9]MDU8912044.1 hypothetical protein [Aestuariicoccus sp. MJ-SS9]